MRKGTNFIQHTQDFFQEKHKNLSFYTMYNHILPKKNQRPCIYQKKVVILHPKILCPSNPAIRCAT